MQWSVSLFMLLRVCGLPQQANLVLVNLIGSSARSALGIWKVPFPDQVHCTAKYLIRSPRRRG
jgi:hypothetical protein